jgi:hypothetical protein
MEKIPAIKQSSSSSEYATTFSDKCKAFLTTLFPASSNTQWLPNESSSYNIQDKVPALTEQELETAIYSSSSKKAPGPNRLSFLLIKKAYSIIPNIFHKVYLNAIELGH